MYGIIGKIIAVEGSRDALASVLLAGISEMPGCLSDVVARDTAWAEAEAGGVDSKTMGQYPTIFARAGRYIGMATCSEHDRMPADADFDAQTPGAARSERQESHE